MKYQGSEYQKKKEEKKMSIGFEIFQKLTQAGLYIVSFFGYFFFFFMFEEKLLFSQRELLSEASGKQEERRE